MSKNFFKKSISVLAGISTLFFLIPVAFADVVSDYILETQTSAFSTIRAPLLNEVLNSITPLATCLRAETAGQPNWQFHASGAPAISTQARLAEALRLPAHPCASQFTALSNNLQRARDAGESAAYPPLVAEIRRNTYPPIIGSTWSPEEQNIQLAKFILYTDCLIAETGGVPNWRAGGSSPPTTIIEMRDRVAVSTHPCFASRALFLNHRRGDPIDRSSGDTVPTANPTTNPTAASTAPASVSPTVAPGGTPITAASPGTVYTGPGFVNVTPFSTFGRISIDRIINNAINYISGFLAIIAVLSIMYGGILYMTARGDDSQVGKAKQVITLTIVGLVIASFAYLIIIFVTRIFYGS